MNTVLEAIYTENSPLEAVCPDNDTLATTYVENSPLEAILE